MPTRAASWDRWLVLLLLLVAVGALALRLTQLDRRPMHNDEAVNAVLLQGLWERGVYRYNPDEYHGPSLHYASLPFLWLSGTPDFDHLSERTLRWVTVAAGVALVLGVGLLRGAMGTTATLTAAILLALSPAMVFYSRYFIHEMLLVLFTLLLLAGAWRYLETGKPVWAAVAGTSLGLMHATKETFVITLAAMGLTVAATLAWNRWRPLSQTRTNPGWHPRHLTLALGLAAAVSLTLFTSFFTHLRGPLDSLLTYLPWLQRAGGHSPHIHPWHAYFDRLLWFQSARGPVWSEAWIAILALIGFGAALIGRGLHAASIGFARFLAFYTVLITAAYVAIPYKTPWCLLNFWMPAILLAGLGTAALLGWARRGPQAWTVGLIWIAGTAHLGWQAWQGSHPLTNHRGNPYIYAQTVPNVLELSDRVKAIAAAGPQGMETSIRVVAAESEYWPLPWYLRQLRNVGWLDQLPEEPYPPILVVGAGLKAALDEKTQKRWLSVGYYELRPREFFELFVEFELWKRFVATLPRPKDDE